MTYVPDEHGNPIPAGKTAFDHHNRCDVCGWLVVGEPMSQQMLDRGPGVLKGHKRCVENFDLGRDEPTEQKKPPFPGIEYDLLYEGTFYWLVERYRGGDRPWRKVARFDDTNDAHAILRRVRRP